MICDHCGQESEIETYQDLVIRVFNIIRMDQDNMRIKSCRLIKNFLKSDLKETFNIYDDLKDKYNRTQVEEINDEPHGTNDGKLAWPLKRG